LDIPSIIQFALFFEEPVVMLDFSRKHYDRIVWRESVREFAFYGDMLALKIT